ncbi:unnamed protein product, partial [Musa acuminata var. zebrina]
MHPLFINETLLHIEQCSTNSQRSVARSPDRKERIDRAQRRRGPRRRAAAEEARSVTPSRGERVPAADVGLTAGASAAEATPARRATETTEAMRIATALAPKAAMARLPF